MLPATNLVVDYIKDVGRLGLEYLSNRYYSKYKGTVSTNVDLAQQGRIKVTVPELGFNSDVNGVPISEELENFAYPSSPFAGNNYGFYFPPEIGDNVWVWFEFGSPTVPNYSGGWWKNPGSDGNGNDKTALTSMIPQEFVSSTGIITKRGIKTKRGHGLQFDDDKLSPTVELWTGEQTIPIGAPATKRQRFVMSDAPTGAGIACYSFAGRKVEIADTLQKITIAGTSGVPAGGGSPLSNQIVIDDFLNTVTVFSKGIVNIQGTGVSLTSAGGGITTINATGVTTANYIGAVSETYIGALTQQVGGVLSQTVVGAWNMKAPTLNVDSQTILLGETSKTKLFLVDERFITAFNAFVAVYNSHTHPAPATPPSTSGSIIVPSTVLTSNTKAS